LNPPAKPSGRGEPIQLEASVTVKIKQSLYCGGGWKRLRADLLRLGDGEYEVTVRKISPTPEKP